MRFGKVLLRMAVGGLFIGHGTQKLCGWFGGEGLDETAQSFESLGLRPGRRNAIAAGTVEAVSGALLAAGLWVPVAAAGLTATMLTAVRTVHLKNGTWNQNGGYEYHLVLMAALFALTDEGPGAFSLDAALGHERKGVAWAVTELAAGVAGSELVMAAAARERAPEEAAESVGEQSIAA
jgi:putative oxidoreductase